MISGRINKISTSELNIPLVDQCIDFLDLVYCPF